MKTPIIAGVIAASLTGAWLLGYGPWQADNPAVPQREVPGGWYNRTDSKASGAGVTAWNMSLGETGVRCLCGGTEEHSGFFVQDHNDGTFTVVRAPDGYSDTIGRRFKAKPVDCLNCAD